MKEERIEGRSLGMALPQVVLEDIFVTEGFLQPTKFLVKLSKEDDPSVIEGVHYVVFLWGRCAANRDDFEIIVRPTGTIDFSVIPRPCSEKEVKGIALFHQVGLDYLHLHQPSKLNWKISIPPSIQLNHHNPIKIFEKAVMGVAIPLLPKQANMYEKKL